MDDDVVFFAMVQRYNIYFKYVSLHHDILGSHGAKSSTENIYWAEIVSSWLWKARPKGWGCPYLNKYKH